MWSNTNPKRMYLNAYNSTQISSADCDETKYLSGGYLHLMCEYVYHNVYHSRHNPGETHTMALFYFCSLISPHRPFNRPADPQATHIPPPPTPLQTSFAEDGGGVGDTESGHNAIKNEKIQKEKQWRQNKEKKTYSSTKRKAGENDRHAHCQNNRKLVNGRNQETLLKEWRSLERWENEVKTVTH